MNDYDKIKNKVIEKYVKGYKFDLLKYNKRDYNRNGYVTIKEHEITINKHIDLEVSRVTFTFNKDKTLKDIDLTGWF